MAASKRATTSEKTRKASKGTRPYEKKPTGDINEHEEYREWCRAQDSATESWRTTELRETANARKEALDGIQGVMEQCGSFSTNDVASEVLREIVDKIAGRLATLQDELKEVKKERDTMMYFLHALKADEKMTWEDKKRALANFRALLRTLKHDKKMTSEDKKKAPTDFIDFLHALKHDKKMTSEDKKNVLTRLIDLLRTLKHNKKMTSEDKKKALTEFVKADENKTSS